MQNLYPLFTMLAQQKLSPKGMFLFWRSMGAYCEASRHMGTFVSSLRMNGQSEAADKIKEIEDSEQYHGLTLALMATCCIKAAGDTEQAAFLERDRKEAARIFSDQVAADSDLVKKALTIVQTCVDLFRARAICTPDKALYFLGITYGVERLANRDIIPGEVDLFIKSGLYPLTLDQPEMGYLREHAEECQGAEGWHEAYMKQLIDTFGTEESIKGTKDIEKATSDWYQELYKLVTSV